MSNRPVIAVENISMAYRLYAKPADLLKETLFGGSRHDAFWALQDISFSVFEKQRVGIIGPNGAGKSTVLQIIAGNLRPTGGRVEVNGTISSLLSLTPAWNPEESGLENIRFNLLMKGTPSQEIPRMTEDIIDFSELGAFIYQPVKTYSSGMGARLSFAIATAVSPEILIIDEVLATGDAYFSGKAYRRMQQMCDRGRALLFVSHSTAAIRALCDRAIWLENGTIRSIGSVEYVTQQYEEDAVRRADETLRSGNMQRLKERMRLVAPEDVTEEDLCRFRLRSELEPSVHETHFIRRIVLSSSDGGEIDVPQHHVDLRKSENVATLDLLSSEWGRAQERRGSNCRALAPRTGARKGGHILVKRPAQWASREWPVELMFEVSALTAKERLVIDFLDVKQGQWLLMEIVERTDVGDGWSRVVCRGALPPVSAMDRERTLQMSEVAYRKPAEILDVGVYRNGTRIVSLKELEDFTIRIRVKHNVPVPGVSVNINISRSDGAYMLYQPSGLDGRNIENFVGESETVFTFDPNPFGAGDFEINVFVCNGWSWDNVPPSDVFDRWIGRCQFRIDLARPITFGLVSAKAIVDVKLYPGAATEIANATAVP